MNKREYELATLINTLQYDIAKLREENSKLREDLREDIREGISLRDHFAGLAMQGLIVADRERDWDIKLNADDAYKQADEMLAEREKRNDL
jgi:hypothetical protein